MAKLVNPILAQREFVAGKALILASDTTVISVTGPDRLSWLHSLLSQNLKNLTPGQSTQALLLDPQGHVEQVINITDDGTTCWLLVDLAGRDALLAWLRKMIFRMNVQVEDRSHEFAVVAGWDRAVAGARVEWRDGWAEVAAGGHRYGAAPEQPYKLVLSVIPVESLPALEAANDWASLAALDALRIAAHRPTAAELDEKTLPHELDLLASAVHLSKGCYRGQETVAKVHNLGHPPRRLVLLHLDGSEHELPPIGSEIVRQNAKPVGRITSVGQHHEMGPIALAVVSRMTPIDAPLLVLTEHGSVAANQEEIVPQDAGKTVDVPKMPRLLMGGKK
jgi:folate-binding protein YgfZ